MHEKEFPDEDMFATVVLTDLRKNSTPPSVSQLGVWHFISELRVEITEK
jgi:hypothetical protein